MHVEGRARASLIRFSESNQQSEVKKMSEKQRTHAFDPKLMEQKVKGNNMKQYTKWGAFVTLTEASISISPLEHSEDLLTLI